MTTRLINDRLIRESYPKGRVGACRGRKFHFAALLFALLSSPIQDCALFLCVCALRPSIIHTETGSGVSCEPPWKEVLRVYNRRNRSRARAWRLHDGRRNDHDIECLQLERAYEPRRVRKIGGGILPVRIKSNFRSITVTFTAGG